MWNTFYVEPEKSQYIPDIVMSIKRHTEYSPPPGKGKVHPCTAGGKLPLLLLCFHVPARHTALLLNPKPQHHCIPYRNINPVWYNEDDGVLPQPVTTFTEAAGDQSQRLRESAKVWYTESIFVSIYYVYYASEKGTGEFTLSPFLFFESELSGVCLVP